MSTIASPTGRDTSQDLVRLAPLDARVEVWHGDTLLAATTSAIELHEVDVPVRVYLPRGDVRTDLLRPIEQTTFCPFKGVASDYWALADDGDGAPVAWSYPQPIGAFSDIAGHVAFYDTVDVRVAR